MVVLRTSSREMRTVKRVTVSKARIYPRIPEAYDYRNSLPPSAPPSKPRPLHAMRDTFDKERVAKAAKMYKSGAAAAQAMGILPSSFSRMCRELGVESPKQRHDREKLERRESRVRNLSQKQVSRSENLEGLLSEASA
jgi:hypothetical protein